MIPSYDCAASVLLCAEDNTAILGLDGDEGGEEECSWAAATPPRDAAAAAMDGLMDLPMLSDECIASLVEREVEHMPMEGYPQRLLQPPPGCLDLAAARRDALDWIWKEDKAWVLQLLAVVCLSLAAKMEETFVPLLLDFQVVEAKCFEASVIKRMELKVLSALNWRTQAVTACSFIDYFLDKFNDHGAPSLLALSRSTDLILSTAKGIEFLAFRPSEIAASVALVALGECRSSVLERSITSCKYISKERVLRCYQMIQDKITLGNIVLRSAGSSIFSVPQSPIGVLDAAACLSQQSDDTTVGSSATCYRSSSASKRRKLGS
uniref:Cyclin C-terminal domain-containing protein n=1 Tax=Leersia perrieri TaxID=77586 RepID=A0A0D9VLB1_9ORYZ